MKKFFKKALCIALGAALLLPCASFAEKENDGITVCLNGEKLDFDVPPKITEGRTLVPFRSIFEALDCAVEYADKEDGQYVYAFCGSDKITLKIGQADMGVNGRTVGLDTAPEITEGRTLVPLRAVSEALGCKVLWDEDTKTVSITKKEEQYKVKTVHISKTVNDGETVLLNINCLYPEISGAENAEFTDKINVDYKAEAEAFVAEYTDYAEDAKLMAEAMGKENYTPMEFERTFRVTLNRNNMLSVTESDYINANGAHPSISNRSKTFIVSEGRELSLAEALGKDEEEVKGLVTEKFTAYMTGIYADISEYYSELIKEEAQNVSWYLTDNSLIMYFNPYQIGPYALGSPEEEIPYIKDGLIKVDLSG